MKRWLVGGTALAALVMGSSALASGELNGQAVAQAEPLQTSPQYTEPGTPLKPYAEAGAEPVELKRKPMLGGISITAGAGADGYWGKMQDVVKPGLAYGLTAAGRPNRNLGIEVGYTGSVHEVRNVLPAGLNAANGADLVRNGVGAALTLGPAWAIQPYALGGFGLNWYQARGATTSLGFRNDGGGAFPVGGGLRSNLGPLVADARFDYNIGVSENFAPVSTSNAGRYEGLFSLGGNF